MSSVWTVTAEIVTAEKRAKWSQALSITWSCSAIAGPLLGGLFSTSALSWRWACECSPLPLCLRILRLTNSLQFTSISQSASSPLLSSSGLSGMSTYRGLKRHLGGFWRRGSTS